MPVPNNLVDSAAISYGLTKDFIARFNQDTDNLMSLLGVVSVERVGAGYTLTQHVITGELNNDGSTAENAATNGTSGSGYVEGDLVALSKYKMEDKPIGKVKLRPYSKVTSAQAISEHGYVPSVVRTDGKMLGDVRADMLSQFFAFLKTGTGTATGNGLQAALVYGEQTLNDALEKNNDNGASFSLVHFVNRKDIADYLASKDVTTQTVYGMQYLQNFLGIENVFITSKVPEKTVSVTPSENLHMYAPEFGELSAAGFEYTVSDNGLIGVEHHATYRRVSVETNILTGATLFAEVPEYIVNSTIATA